MRVILARAALVDLLDHDVGQLGVVEETVVS